MTEDGLESPTLHVNPGDTLNIAVTNNTPASPLGEPLNPPNCGDTTVEATPPFNGIASVGSSVNIHYHGTNVSPRCHGDNVTRTLINSGSTFQYSFRFPDDAPPGLYWYHPHVHGLTERDVLGGASGALVVDGIQNVQPAVSGLPPRILVIRDQPQLKGLEEGPGNCGNGVPFQDLSVNYVPIDSTLLDNGLVAFTPATFRMMPEETQFWRVTHSTADTILDLLVIPSHLAIIGGSYIALDPSKGTYMYDPVAIYAQVELSGGFSIDKIAGVEVKGLNFSDLSGIKFNIPLLKLPFTMSSSMNFSSIYTNMYRYGRK